MNTEELMSNLKKLNDSEQDQIKVLSAIFINETENLKNDKLESLKNSLIEQINFYGRNAEKYIYNIEKFEEDYSNLIDLIINEYNTRFISILNELQNTQCNQKIAITNMKLSLDSNNKIRFLASENKKANFEIIIQECYSQIDNCINEVLNKIDEIFYNKDRQLLNLKDNIINKFINIFIGKKKIEKFVIESTSIEMNNLESTVNSSLKRINEETIDIVAEIKELEIQTQNIFNKMVEGKNI